MNCRTALFLAGLGILFLGSVSAQEGDVSLANAVDCPDLAFTTGGSALWTSNSMYTAYGKDRAQSGAIGNSQSSWLQTRVTGPALVSFWWNVSSEKDRDELSFSIRGNVREAISGTSGMWYHRKALLGDGAHALRWKYSKDGSNKAGSDSGYVDHVEVLPYPARQSYHTPRFRFYGQNMSPLDNDVYFPPNGLSGAFWDQREDGTWTCHVYGSDGSPGVLQDVIDFATPGDTIVVEPGCYDPVVVDVADVAIVSVQGREKTFINGKYADRCVTFTDAAKGSFLSGFMLVQGHAADNGGGVSGGALRNCIILGCVADQNGGGAYNASLTDCILSGNKAQGNGGGACLGSLNRCKVSDNDADGNGGGVQGVSATGCLLSYNYAIGRAGGADASSLMNCTVAKNTAIESHGGVWRCAVRNSIVSDNDAPGAANWGPADTGTTFACSCASPLPPGTGNVNVSPGFVDLDKGNFHLSNISKCRDKGNRNLTRAPYDLSGLDRVMGSNVDIGCYEYATGVTPLDPADYDGDGVPDIGFYNPATYTWFIRQTDDDTVRREKLGFAGVIIVPRDYDGDGIRDPAIYNPNSGYWQILQSATGEVAVKKLGWKGINLVDAADTDGDGKADPIIFNPATKTWQVLHSSGGGTTVVKNFGWAGIKLVCGDYDGDGWADLAFYSPASGNWYVRWQDGTQSSLTLGVPGARIFPLDADFDGTLDPCYFDPATGKWTWKSLVNDGGDTVKFGDSTVTPHPFDWDGDGMPDTFGFYSPYRAGFLDLYLSPDGSRAAHMINF